MINSTEETIDYRGAPGRDGQPGMPGKDGKDGKDGINGRPGEPGLKGDKGDPGEKGNPGPQGIQGIKGDKGDKGDTGEPGSKGDKGDTGKPGADGLPGLKGDIGSTGAQGEPGERGPQGIAGPQGPKGEQGKPGKDAPFGAWVKRYDIGGTSNPAAPTSVICKVNLNDDSASGVSVILTAKGGNRANFFYGQKHGLFFKEPNGGVTSRVDSDITVFYPRRSNPNLNFEIQPTDTGIQVAVIGLDDEEIIWKGELLVASV